MFVLGMSLLCLECGIDFPINAIFIRQSSGQIRCLKSELKVHGQVPV